MPLVGPNGSKGPAKCIHVTTVSHFLTTTGRCQDADSPLAGTKEEVANFRFPIAKGEKDLSSLTTSFARFVWFSVLNHFEATAPNQITLSISSLLQDLEVLLLSNYPR